MRCSVAFADLLYVELHEHVSAFRTTMPSTLSLVPRSAVVGRLFWAHFGRYFFCVACCFDVTMYPILQCIYYVHMQHTFSASSPSPFQSPSIPNGIAPSNNACSLHFVRHCWWNIIPCAGCVLYSLTLLLTVTQPSAPRRLNARYVWLDTRAAFGRRTFPVLLTRHTFSAGWLISIAGRRTR